MNGTNEYTRIHEAFNCFTQHNFDRKWTGHCILAYMEQRRLFRSSINLCEIIILVGNETFHLQVFVMSFDQGI